MRASIFIITAVATFIFTLAFGAPVEMKNIDAMAIMVPIGSENGVEVESDFEVVDSNGAVVTEIFPFELYKRYFWSQPLDRKVYDSVKEGMEVRRVELAKKPHWEIRYKGWAWKLQQKRERVKELLDRINTLWNKSETMWGDLDSLAQQISPYNVSGNKESDYERERADYESLRDELTRQQDKLTDLVTSNRSDERRIERQRKKVEEVQDDLDEQRDVVRDLEIELRVLARDKSAALEHTRDAIDGLKAEAKEINSELWK
ncbi:MAG: hypothetical protein C0609_00715, partial [Deltaproteobacteria bacterium]